MHNPGAGPLLADDVLRRYEAELPEFDGLQLRHVNQLGSFGNAPLKCAAVRGLIEEISALLDAGADVSILGEHGYTPLHHAIEQGHAEAVRLLLARGASVAAVTDFEEGTADLAERSEVAEIRDLFRR